ncbi:MAG TPA: hypothetical protein VMH40_04235 [Myxococcaceae bacterium]|nr:hypothetical protein [Myxococcaceae bacterium]
MAPSWRRWLSGSPETGADLGLRGEDWAPWWAPPAIALVLAGGLVGWQWLGEEHRRELIAMPPGERHERFLSVRRDAQAMCPRRELRTQCRAELDELLQFPDCDEECRSFAARMRRTWMP